MHLKLDCYPVGLNRKSREEFEITIPTIVAHTVIVNIYNIMQFLFNTNMNASFCMCVTKLTRENKSTKLVNNVMYNMLFEETKDLRLVNCFCSTQRRYSLNALSTLSKVPACANNANQKCIRVYMNDLCHIPSLLNSTFILSY